jgi:hypothetical protein
LVVLAGFALAGCDGDDDGPTTTDTGSVTTAASPTTTTTTPTPADVSALESVAESGSSTPSRTLSEAEFQALLDSIRPPSNQELIARDLNAIDASWGATGADIERFVTTACRQSTTTAVDDLARRFPGAGLDAIPAFNRAIALVPLTCGPVRPGAMDELSSGVTKFTVTNEFQRSVQEPSYLGQFKLPTATEQRICNAAKLGKPLAEWAGEEIIKYVSRGRASGGLALSLFLEGAVAGCPQWIVQLRGG